MRSTIQQGALVFAVLLAACSPAKPAGRCSVQRFPVPGTSYSETKEYCASAAECTAYCSALRGRTDTGNCSHDPTTRFCLDGNLPPVPAPEMFCAVYRSIACGGGRDNFEPHCDGYSCMLQLNDSDYDPGLGCTTRIGSNRGTGRTCDEALADLTGTRPPSCPAASGDTACSTCLKGSCCAQLSACDASTDCRSLLTCLSPCASDSACRNACGTRYPGAVTTYNAIIDCRDASCVTACR